MAPPTARPSPGLIVAPPGLAAPAPPAPACGAAAILALISAAIAMNACSTLALLLAEVSKKGMPASSAKALAVAVSTTFCDSCYLFIFWGGGGGVEVLARCRSVPRQTTLRSEEGGGRRCEDKRKANERRGKKKKKFLSSHQVGLVPDEELVDALRGVAVDLREPLLDVVERLLVGDVVDNLFGFLRVSIFFWF